MDDSTPPDFRAWSLQQPWLHFITHAPQRLAKRVENRKTRWDCWRRFPKREVLLHASQGEPRSEWAAARDHVRRFLPELAGWADALDRTQVAHGGIVARVRIIGIVTPDGRLALEKGEPMPEGGIDLRWHIPGRHGYVLDDVRLTPFAPCPGHLGFWRVPKPAVNLLL